MKTKLLAGFFALLLIQPVLAQIATNEDKDRQWVTDKLRLSLYQNADAQSQVIRYLNSGDLLEIEQISGAYAFVTAPDGTKGWVKRGFLVTEPTSNIQLEAEQEKTQQLEAEIEKLGNSKVVIDQYEKDMDVLVDKIEALEQEKQQAADSITDLEGEIEARDEAERQRRENTRPAHIVLWETFVVYWQVVVPIIIGIMILSFLVTKALIESRIRSRFQGIKVW